MYLLTEIRDISHTETIEWSVRDAVRAIIFDSENRIPLMYTSRYNFHKLPGGGVKKGEDNETAIVREIREEVGCEITLTHEVGKIVEYRSEWKCMQTSYCFLGALHTQGTPVLTNSEVADGYRVVWCTLRDAIHHIQDDVSDTYEWSFIQKRELCFLHTVEKMNIL